MLWIVISLYLGAAPRTSAVDCFNVAKDALRLTDAQAVRLCQGAPSDGPARCAQRVEAEWLGLSDETHLDSSEIIRLCRASPQAIGECAG
jgi:hypothetical protein